MKTWKIDLKFPDDSDKTIEIFDGKTYFSGYLKIKRSYFNELIKTVKMTKSYNIGRAIEKVVGPDKEDWTLNPWMLIIVKDNEKNKPFWFFIKRERDLSGLLVGIGPEPFAEYNSSNQEARREIKRLINYIIAYLNKFECLILLPNYLP
ncbi:MAG: hypothetical protein EU544_01855 [Promethearchaeota archaeon]|nr:MAG: hypothetical protein EU544_01855 [Candidatus Lokiarchaeota archaeon]